VSRLRTGCPKLRTRFPERISDVSIVRIVTKGSGGTSTLQVDEYPGGRAVLPRGQVAGREADSAHPSGARVKNA
jgi:hypothetical protein